MLRFDGTVKVLPGALPKRGLALVRNIVSWLLICFSAVSAAHAATAPNGAFGGNAYGTYSSLKAGQIAAVLGFTAAIPCPCEGTNGATLSNGTDSLSAGNSGNVLRAATIRSTVHTDQNDLTGISSVQNTSAIQGLNALNGLITADAVAAVANTTADATSITSDANGSTFVNLRVAGTPIDANVAPNTTLTLPGVGSVTLKKQVSSSGAVSGFLVIEMITINVTTANSFNLPIGSHIVVAHAMSGFSRLAPGAGLVSGVALAASSSQIIGDLLKNQIGSTAYVSMGCGGTGGQTLTNNIGGIGIPPVLSLGTGTTTAVGGPITGGADAKTTATVFNAGLLNGLISATAVKAVAETKIVSGVRTRSTAGTVFSGLKVLGVTLPVNVAPNTRVILPGIGYVILNEQIIPPATSAAPTQVNGIHVYVTTANALKIPVGVQLFVAHAHAAAQKL